VQRPQQALRSLVEARDEFQFLCLFLFLQEFIIPAFNKSWPNFIFFGLYLYVGVFFLTAILLAIIVESYWDYSKRHVKEERRFAATTLFLSLCCSRE